ncbi:MIF4G domain-containing protein B [Opisthocomus hoazin]|uniref:MIF4G domain-containing protein B n=1 Tax=Opisthocomus hoazin TaxID=30419 RepID=A0A091WDT4_OPIHO|nr:MIF4G domain-containing protein B [Opisthocomus hoazin]
MGETGREEYKIQSFDTETQKLLKTALKGTPKQAGHRGCWVLTVFLLSADPSNVDLEKVANIIVDQSLKDCVFSKEAGRICYTIIQPASTDSCNFPASLGNHRRVSRGPASPKCQHPPAPLTPPFHPSVLVFWARRQRATFICNIFDYLRVNNMPMMALVNPVYDCLFRLAQPDSLRKEEEVDCLVLQLHRIGEQLEKMNSPRMDELFSLLRDGFLLQEGLSSLSQLLLLEIIEFRAADWKMTDAAQKYYYSEVTD